MQSKRAPVGIVLVGLLLSGVFGLDRSVQAQIAFVRIHSVGINRTDIYVMDMDGGNQRRLPNNAVEEGRPTWSPDGKSIAFGDGRDIRAIDADGRHLRTLTDRPSIDADPSWSPDGQQIAFIGDAGPHSDIYVMDADGGNIKRLTRRGGTNWAPSWSPDGRQIAFQTIDRRGGNINWEVYVIDADGRRERNLTNHPSYDGVPSWSPDGRQIAFMAWRDGSYEICVMDADGSNPRNLTNSPSSDGSPSWSQDGRHIVFSSSEVDEDEFDGFANGEIYIMDADGANPRNLTNDPDSDFFPACIPRALMVSPAGRRTLTWGWIKEGGSEVE